MLLGKTGGYVIGYIFIALATALAVKRSGKRPVIGAAMLAGLLICYGFGTAWFLSLIHIYDTIPGFADYVLGRANVLPDDVIMIGSVSGYQYFPAVSYTHLDVYKRQGHTL